MTHSHAIALFVFGVLVGTVLTLTAVFFAVFVSALRQHDRSREKLSARDLQKY